MPVFKLCLKIFKKKLPVMMIYVGLFLGISLLIASATRTEREKGFVQSKTNIAIINYDQTPLVTGLINSLEEIANIVPLEDASSALQDALYFRKVTYILRIPEDFTEKFLKGDEVWIEKTSIPNSVDAVYVDLQVNQYLRIAELYKSQSHIDHATIADYIKKDMEIETKVNFNGGEEVKQDQSYAMYYYNYLAYSLFSILILGISTIMLVFNNQDLRRRNACSPVTAGSSSFQFVLANGVFAVICWAIMVGFCILFDYKNSNTTNTLLFLINSFVFTLCAVSISFLVGNLVKNQEGISALTNVIALGPSFISGVFVPQEFLGENVLKIASFTPTYWYVKANSTIANLNSFDLASLRETMGYTGVVLGFAIAFLSLALVVGKKKQLSQEA
ncbi:ABC transporter permease [Petrocella atlantisensis]|uniref:ABC transporter permease n=1 Tax=Petrocella atlantisensis TaxID=2173034 RepID=A0A3P7P0X1_9FIRM|nr:ABC transporter permease [Petrocella atlantisensis]MCF8020250.1 ABC transporter permease [Vallitaleaceae bacterium]VDN48835.1 ABC transporter permease [Petrocella atlantisensis]